VTPSSLLFGLQLGQRRVSRARVLLAALAVVGFAAAVALAERQLDLLGAASRSLQGGAFGFIVPLATLGAVGLVLGNESVAAATTPLARFGISRRPLAFGLTAGALATASALAAAIAFTTALCAHDPWAPPLGQDLLSSTWIGALVGAAYAGLYSFGATFGRRGGGRGFVFLFDFVFGASGSALSVFAPRAHALHLLGGEPPLDGMSQGASAVVLAVMTVAGVAATLARCPR